MTRALFVLLLLAASTGFARPKVRPKPDVSPVRQGASQPTPLPAPGDDKTGDLDPLPKQNVDPDDQPPTADDDAPPSSLFDDDDKTPPSSGTTSSTTGKKHKTKEEENQEAALGFGIMCCCFLFFVGLIVLIVWLVRRSGKPAQPGARVNTGAGVGVGGTAGPFHLSVAAIALDARLRGTVDARVYALGGAGAAGSPPTRAAVARAISQALLEQKENWRWFGYGEKPLMYAFGEADLSFRAATDDFKARANTAVSSPEGELVVYTLVACANRLLKGVTRLDSPAEAQEVFLERSRVQDHEVFGGEVIASPLQGGLSEAELTQRYPEMNRLVSSVGG